MSGALGPYWGYLVSLMSAMLPAVLIGSYFLYQKVWHHTEMLRRLRNFRLAETQCVEPRDVDFVFGLIDVMWRSSPTADDGRARFEHFVRHELAPQMEPALGARTRLSYPVALVAFFPLFSICPMLGLVCDAHMLEVWGYSLDRLWPWSVRWVVYGIELWCFANPVTTTCVQLAIARAVDAGRGTAACVAAGSVVYLAVLWPLIGVIVRTVMYQPAETGLVSALGGGALLLALALLSWHPPEWLERVLLRRILRCPPPERGGEAGGGGGAQHEKELH